MFIDEKEIKLNVNVQYFISDLPAKSLFMKTINFNGYYACTNCFTEGNFKEFNENMILSIFRKSILLVSLSFRNFIQ